jgi:hypothetical protein
MGEIDRFWVSDQFLYLTYTNSIQCHSINDKKQERKGFQKFKRQITEKLRRYFTVIYSKKVACYHNCIVHPRSKMRSYHQIQEIKILFKLCTTSKDQGTQTTMMTATTKQQQLWSLPFPCIISVPDTMHDEWLELYTNAEVICIFSYYCQVC